ncbi:MAG: hypothetical protein JO194_08820 [Candidatus Eremiobacteraeota bacterium]|nr:hypothetical protein [Candidatus Eremiobacteraeota bacterium]
MIHTLGVILTLLGLLAIVIIAVLTALRVRTVVAAAATLRSHPMFEPQWRAAQTQKIERLQSGSVRLREDLIRLGPALATLAVALYELGSLAYKGSPSVDAAMRRGLPWLAGLLRPRSHPS